MKDPGRIRVGAVVYFGAECIPCHILDVPGKDGLAQGAFNEDTTRVILGPFNGRLARKVPTTPVPYADTPTAGAWSFNREAGR